MKTHSLLLVAIAAALGADVVFAANVAVGAVLSAQEHAARSGEQEDHRDRQRDRETCSLPRHAQVAEPPVRASILERAWP